MLLKNKKRFAESWNFGPYHEDVINVESLVKQIIKIWGKGKYKIKTQNKHYESKLLKLDITKSQCFLNWKPVYSSQKSILETIMWYKEFYSNKNIINFSKEQIKLYVKEAKNKKIKWAK